MVKIEWNRYRHSNFLQSLDLSNIDKKYLNFFLKSTGFNHEKIETPSKYIVKEQVKT
jgi:hypothetical protein